MTTHTPGPWIKAKYKVRTAGGDLIAHTRPTGEGSSDDEANARLIAAAPALLAALGGLLAVMSEPARGSELLASMSGNEFDKFLEEQTRLTDAAVKVARAAMALVGSAA